MKSLRFIAMAGFVAFCIGVLGSQSSSFAQGRSGKSKGNSTMGQTRSTDAIRRGIERVTGNRADRNRTDDRDNDWRMGNSRNRRHKTHTNNGVRDYGRGIGRGKGQGKGRGYAKRLARHRHH